jgi:hypothetical protein
VATYPKELYSYIKNYHPLPWRDSISHSSNLLGGKRRRYHYLEHVAMRATLFFNGTFTLIIRHQPWRLGVVVIVAANITEDRGFESRQGLRFLGLNTLQCCSM